MAAVCIGIAVALASADSVTADVGFGPPVSLPATHMRHVAADEHMAGLRGSDKTGNALFGVSVSLSADGSTAVIGASSDGGVGAAWVFTQLGGLWTQQGPKLTGRDATGSFGVSVSLSADGNAALIGGAGDNGGVGAAWVFTRSGGVWTQQGPKLTGADGTGNGLFGTSVSLSADGTTALIGGPGDGPAGAAWVFTQSGGVWAQQGPKLTGSDETGNGSFGLSVWLSADGTTALVGGYGDNGGVGAAWVFTQSGGVWAQQGPKLTGSDATGTGSFGVSVSLSAVGTSAVIGDGGLGAAWVFTRSGGVWTQQGSRLTASSPSLPAPIVAKTANAQPVKGTVLVKQPGKRGFVQLSAATHIPIGSELDTTQGTVSLTTAAGGGKTQTGLFHGGLFKLGQKKGKRPFTELALAARLRCVNSRASAHAGAKRRTSRQLFGDAHGRFRMRGRHSVATVRGTKWLVKDTCNSTLTVSQRGTVVVQDLVKHRTITLHTGQRYLARRGNR